MPDIDQKYEITVGLDLAEPIHAVVALMVSRVRVLGFFDMNELGRRGSNITPEGLLESHATLIADIQSAMGVDEETLEKIVQTARKACRDVWSSEWGATATAARSNRNLAFLHDRHVDIGAANRAKGIVEYFNGTSIDQLLVYVSGDEEAERIKRAVRAYVKATVEDADSFADSLLDRIKFEPGGPDPSTDV